MTKLYFSADGSWGDATDIVLLDTKTIPDTHFFEMIDDKPEWDVPHFVRWSIANQHTAVGDGSIPCVICMNYDDDLTPEQILADWLDE